MKGYLMAKKKRLANDLLFELGAFYHDGIPVDRINAILTVHGFTKLEPGIYCGRDGKVHEQVGTAWLSLTWHKMEVTGRYEIVAYLS